MKRILTLIATGVLASGMAVAQARPDAAPPPQDNNTATSTDQSGQAAKPKDASSARPADTTAGADQNATAATDSNAKTSSDANAAADPNAPKRPESADASNQTGNQPQQANTNRGGVPWLWIALGVVALIVLFSLLGGRDRSPDRVDRVTTIDRRETRVDDRRDDDIRRVG